MQTPPPGDTGRKNPPRGKAFSDSECLAITKSMMLAKNNPVKGDGTKLDDYLQAFRKHFDKMQQAHWPERPTSALFEKFTHIRRDCHKFISYLGLVQKQAPISGSTRSPQSDVEKATQDFLKKEGKPFLHYSSYPHFRDQPSSGLSKPRRWQPSTPLGGAARPNDSQFLSVK